MGGIERDASRRWLSPMPSVAFGYGESPRPPPLQVSYLCCFGLRLRRCPFLEKVATIAPTIAHLGQTIDFHLMI